MKRAQLKPPAGFAPWTSSEIGVGAWGPAGGSVGATVGAAVGGAGVGGTGVGWAGGTGVNVTAGTGVCTGDCNSRRARAGVLPASTAVNSTLSNRTTRTAFRSGDDEEPINGG